MCDKDVNTQHLPMVYHLAGLVARKNDTRADELLGVAWLGFESAKRRFDPTRGVKFATYAYHMVLGYLRTEIQARKNLDKPRPGSFTDVGVGSVAHKLRYHDHAGFREVDDADELEAVTRRTELTAKQKLAYAAMRRGDSGRELARQRGVSHDAGQFSVAKTLSKLRAAAGGLK